MVHLLLERLNYFLTRGGRLTADSPTESRICLEQVMNISARTPVPTSATEANAAHAAAKPALSEDDVGPSRVMEIGLHGLVTGLLIVSIIGIAYVYGFNLDTGSLLDNISAAVRALGVDGGFFLGLYFSRRLWMRRKRGWGDGIKTTLFGLIWFLVALLMASLSWFSNTLFVTNYQTIITQDLLSRAGFTSISPQLVNKAIGAIPLVIVLLYSIVPRRMQTQVDTRTAEEIEAEALREAARIRAQNMVAAARAEGAGQRIRTVLGGLVTEAFNLEERQQRDERLKQMRIALETAGHESSDLSDEQVEIQAVSRGVWDQTNNRPFKAAPRPDTAAEDRWASMTRQPRLAKHEALAVDALGQEELEVWQPIERPWGDAEGLPDQPDAQTDRSRASAGTARVPGSRPALDEPDGAAYPKPTEPVTLLTLAELADALHVAHGTIAFWTRPEFDGPTKIFAHEIVTDLDGIKSVRPEVLLRLLRVRAKAGLPKANGVAPNSQGALPVGAAVWKSNGNHS